MTSELLDMTSELLDWDGIGRLVKFKKSIIPPMVCKDGFKMSLQASENHYCSPKNNEGPWSSWEVGYPSEKEELLMPYADNPDEPIETVYAFVPHRIIIEIIEKHGGFAHWWGEEI